MSEFALAAEMLAFAFILFGGLKGFAYLVHGIPNRVVNVNRSTGMNSQAGSPVNRRY